MLLWLLVLVPDSASVKGSTVTELCVLCFLSSYYHIQTGCRWEASEVALLELELEFSALVPVTRSEPQPLTFCVHAHPKSNEAIGHLRKATPTQRPLKKIPPWHLLKTSNHQHISDMTPQWSDRALHTGLKPFWLKASGIRQVDTV